VRRLKTLNLTLYIRFFLSKLARWIFLPEASLSIDGSSRNRAYSDCPCLCERVPDMIHRMWLSNYRGSFEVGLVFLSVILLQNGSSKSITASRLFHLQAQLKGSLKSGNVIAS